MTTFSKGEGVKLPPFACQTTFIPGGLVLSVWFYHAIADGSGNRRIQEVWSAAVRALRKEAPSVLTGQEDMRGASSIHQGVGEKGEKDGPIDETDASAARRALEDFVRSKGAEDGVNDPECIQASLLPPHPLRSSSYSVVTKLFRFPCSAITNLSTHLSSLTGTHISHFAALAAVVWADVLHARLPLMLATGNYKSSLAVVVDLRKYLPAPFSSPDYLGNLVYSTMTTWTLSQQEKEEDMKEMEEEGVGQAYRVVPLHPPPQPTINNLKKQSLPPVMSVSAPVPSPESSSKPSLPHLASLALKITDSVHEVNESWISPHLSTVLTSPFHLIPTAVSASPMAQISI
jgi:hypothetical protein